MIARIRQAAVNFDIYVVIVFAKSWMTVGHSNVSAQMTNLGRLPSLGRLQVGSAGYEGASE